VQARQGRCQTALRTFVRAIQGFRRRRDRRGPADALVNMGHVLQCQERWALAKTCFLGAERLYRRLGAKRAAHLACLWGKECDAHCRATIDDAVWN
jgi:hypothetical protein